MNTNFIATLGLITGGLSLIFSAYQFFRNRNQQVETSLISIMRDYIKSQNWTPSGNPEVDRRSLWQWSAGNLVVVHAYGRYHRLVPWWERKWDRDTQQFLKTFRQLLDEDRALMKVTFKAVTGQTPEEAASDAQS
jgi:hypothetical protein